MSYLDCSVTKRAEIDHAKSMCDAYPGVSYNWYLLYKATQGTSEEWTQKKLLEKIKKCTDYDYYQEKTMEEIGGEISEKTKLILKKTISTFGKFLGTFFSLIFSLFGILLLMAAPELLWMIPVAVLIVFVIIVSLSLIVTSFQVKVLFNAYLIGMIEREEYSLFINHPELYQ